MGSENAKLASLACKRHLVIHLRFLRRATLIFLQVASRLGLVSLSFLWMQPQKALFQSMIDSGINAILVKVAALGLEPQKHLGKTLQQMQPILYKLARFILLPYSAQYDWLRRVILSILADSSTKGIANPPDVLENDSVGKEDLEVQVQGKAGALGPQLPQ